MNINPDYSKDETNYSGSIELAEMALDSLEDNIINKVSDQLDFIDIVGFASARAILEAIAKKAQAYEVMILNKNQFERN